MRVIDLVQNLLGRMAEVDEQVIVRIVTRNPDTGNVIKAKHAQVSYLKTLSSNTEAICIEEVGLVDVSVDYQGE